VISIRRALPHFSAASILSQNATCVNDICYYHHFHGYTRLFAPELNFSGRNRRPPRDPVNACLSLGYTLLHFDAVRAAHAAGLDALLGFYHRPAVGRESLACDLIEPIRPLVDDWLWTQFSERHLRSEHFSDDRGACLIGKAGRSHFYASWETFAPLPRRWLRTTCARLAAELRVHGSAWMLADDGDEEAGEETF
jgi:CRISPR-associated protein Cas1